MTARDELRSGIPLPTFFVLGAPKCGTSSLYHYLGQHEDVLLSTPKEPQFFEAEYHRGIDFYTKRYFADWSGERARGDAGPRNLFVPYVARRIKDTTPEARLVAILRNPIERAYSAWWMVRSYGYETLSFEDAVEDNLRRVEAGDPFDRDDAEERWRRFLAQYAAGHLVYRTYVDTGHYATQLHDYLELFDRSQLKVILFDDLRRDPEGVTRDVWQFIGVAPDHAISDLSARKVAFGPTGSRLARWSRRTRLDAVIPPRARSIARRVLVRAGDRRPPMAGAVAQLLADHYRSHNRQLEALLGRDLSHWGA